MVSTDLLAVLFLIQNLNRLCLLPLDYVLLGKGVYVSTAIISKSSKKQIYSWALYDWANSAYSTTIMAGFFPIFFKKFWSMGTDPIVTTARLGVAISVSSFLIAMMTPTLGVIADMRGTKKRFCLIFMVIGALGSAWMTFIPVGQWVPAIMAYGLSMMAFNASSVFNDSLLPVVAKKSEMDYASSLGYSLGYLGGGILFALNVLMYMKPEIFGLRDGTQAVQVSFLTVGVWWFVFSIPLAKFVHEPKPEGPSGGLHALTRESVARLIQTVKHLSKDRNLLFFLLAYWLYIDGVYTVMTMAVDYGISIGLEAGDLMTALLITQFIGFPFALLFGFVAKRFGCRLPILICIAVYSVAVVLSTFMKTAMHFYMLAVIIGMVQGGVQSLSRSLFGRMIPSESSGEYFGLFNLVGKFASILGPLLVAIGVTVSGSSRHGMTSLLVLFIIGGALLYRVKEPEPL